MTDQIKELKGLATGCSPLLEDIETAIKQMTEKDKRHNVQNHLPFDSKPGQAKIDYMNSEAFIAPKSFGAIVISRPYFSTRELNKFRIYTVNPGIVQSWFRDGRNAEERIKECIPDKNLPDSDVRLLYNVNELRVRTPTQLVRSTTNGSADLSWIETGSGNEFLIQSDLWISKS